MKIKDILDKIQILSDFLKFILVLTIGLLVGIIIHGIIEIPVLWVLTNIFQDFFSKVSWQVWILIHHIFSIIVEILGVFLTFRLYRKYEK